MEETIFDKIIRREVPADIVAETDELIAFRDIRPLAPVHVLIIPKRRIVSINELEDADALLVGNMFTLARDIARDLNISENGYKLLIRTGRDGGQEIPHLHLHLIGGTRLTEHIGPVEADTEAKGE
jgi:histidine triad (HIT) family protein